MERKELFELTNPQKSIWLTEQYCSNTNINNICGFVVIEEKVNIDLLKLAIFKYVKQNDAMRMHFILENDIPKQFVSNFDEFKIDIIKCTTDSMDQISSDLSKEIFNLIDSDLFSFKILELENGSASIFTNVHHLISDAWSLSIYSSEIIDIYSKLAHKEAPSNTVAPSYIEYYNKELNYLNSNKYINDLEYWTNTIPKNFQKTFIKNNLSKSYETIAKREIFSLDKHLLKKITKYCDDKKCSLYTFFMAIYSIYLSKINEKENVTIGTPILNRSTHLEKNTFGMFISTTPFFVDIDENLSFDNFINHTLSLQKTLFRHQKFPYIEIQNLLKRTQDFSETIFDVVLSYQNSRNKFKEGNVKYHTTWNFTGHTLNTLDVHFYDMNDTGSINVFYDYQINKLSKFEIELIHERIIYMINQVLDVYEKNTQENEKYNLLISDIKIIPDNEFNLLTKTFNDSYVKYPKDKCIHELIDEISIKNPNEIAVVHKNQSITYLELKEKSDNIAKYLITNGIKPGNCVSILFDEKNIDLICSILGVLKSGASFLALYAEYPKERLSFILKNSDSKALITSENFIKNYNSIIKCINILDIEKNIKSTSLPKINHSCNCYSIYTSGSTGTPKGINISHRNLMNFIYGLNHNFNNTISKIDKFLSVTNISFDVSMQEIFTPLVYGASLYLYKDLNYSYSEEVAKYVVDNSITFAYFPPSMLDSIYSELDKLKSNLENKNSFKFNKMLVGVEPIKSSTLSNYMLLNRDMIILNGYGPSETTICCSMYIFDNNLAKTKIVPIGKPIANSKILLLNSKKELLPLGEIGEIYVEGDCVGNGYIKNNILNNSVYDLNKKIFKTGDFAKWLPNGNLKFIGRKDSQIKFNGYRIDLGEIEYNLMTLSNMQNCFVCINKTETKEQLLSFVIVNDSTITANYIRNYLSTKLPHYMIPSDIILMDSFPLTPSGKIDKKFLIASYIDIVQADKISPKTKLQKELCRLWEKTLDVKNISINDNFFNIGGDSLLAIKVSLISSEIGIKLTAQDFYKYPTIELLSNYYESNRDLLETNYIKELDIYKKVNQDNSTFKNLNINSNNNSNILLLRINWIFGISYFI